MSFLEYPKALYHPTTKELVIVEGPDDEAAKLEEWDVAPVPQIPLGEKPADAAEGASEKSEAE